MKSKLTPAALTASLVIFNENVPRMASLERSAEALMTIKNTACEIEDIDP